MPVSEPITQTVMLHLKEDVIPENMVSSTVARGSPAEQAFVQLTKTVTGQLGFIRQFWGHQVEDPFIFVWSINSESLEHSTTFDNSEDYSSFVAGIGGVYDLEVAAPLTTLTRFTSDATATCVAQVMEAAFFAVPNGPREQPKTLIENNSLMFDAKKAGDASPDVESIALHGIFGYASFDDHPNWRETPEHARIIEKMGRSPLKLGNAIVPSGCIFVPDSSMFHVKFHAGI